MKCWSKVALCATMVAPFTKAREFVLDLREARRPRRNDVDNPWMLCATWFMRHSGLRYVKALIALPFSSASTTAISQTRSPPVTESRWFRYREKEAFGHEGLNAQRRPILSRFAGTPRRVLFRGIPKTASMHAEEPRGPGDEEKKTDFHEEGRPSEVRSATKPISAGPVRSPA